MEQVLPNFAALANLLFQMMIPNLGNFRRQMRMVLVEQEGLQKTFPDVPIVFRVSRGNPESRLRTSLRLGMIKG